MVIVVALLALILVSCGPAASAPPSVPVSPALTLHALPDGVWREPRPNEPQHAVVSDSDAGVPTGVPVRLVLGHCGLLSPVDLDGALWKPIGAIDQDGGPVDTQAEIGELINATAGTAMLISHDLLHLRTLGGTMVAFARAQGPLGYLLCD